MGKPRAIGWEPNSSQSCRQHLKIPGSEFPAVIGALHLVTVFLDVSILGVPGFRVLHFTILV